MIEAAGRLSFIDAQMCVYLQDMLHMSTEELRRRVLGLGIDARATSHLHQL